jgi:exonuclease SbcD
MRLLHTADLHFSPKPEKLREVVAVTDYLLERAAELRPDAAVLAGDTFDEHDGAIRLDSDTARAALGFVQRLADLCPVLVVRGTPSHDRNAPEILRELRTRYPVHVSTRPEQVVLMQVDGAPMWAPLPAAVGDDPLWVGAKLQAVFTCFPTPEKAWLLAQGFGSIREANATARELIHDLFAGFGLVNAELGFPRVLVAHGMVTGARLGPGITAVGEDLEFGLEDLAAARVDYVALGHVHEAQCWGITDDGTAAGRLATRVCYSGSPGRLNFGETGPKGFFTAELAGAAPPTADGLLFHATPARRFVFGEGQWTEEDGAHGVLAALDDLLGSEELPGADVRFRFDVPEEHVHVLDPAELRERLLAAGAREAKVERTIVPKVRVRAEGISRLTTLPEKVARWGETVEQAIPEGVLTLAGRIAGLEAEEIAAEALARVERAHHSGDATDMIPPPEDAPKDYRGRVIDAVEAFAAKAAQDNGQEWHPAMHGRRAGKKRPPEETERPQEAQLRLV